MNYKLLEFDDYCQLMTRSATLSDSNEMPHLTEDKTTDCSSAEGEGEGNENHFLRFRSIPTV